MASATTGSIWQNGTDETEVLHYTASHSPFLQGVNLHQPHQLTNYTIVKIRSNTGFITTLDRVPQTQNFFNESLAPENLGTSGTGSLVSVDVAGKLGQCVYHVIDRRDLGQSLVYDDDSPFVEATSLESSPVEFMMTNPLAVSLPTSLVQVTASPLTMDGVIEPFDIRKVADRSSIELPYVARGLKGDMCVVNAKRESLVFDDKKNIKNSSTRPFLDSQESFGGVDLPGAFSDADSNMRPFIETTQRELFYVSGTLDEEIRHVLVDGFVSASTTYKAFRTENIRVDEVIARHGFVFSQNDNYTYDSIVYGGLKK